MLCAVFLLGVEIMAPLRLDHLLSMLPQFVSMYLLFCILANLYSIYSPAYLNPGTLKFANPKATVVLMQLLMFLVFFPICQAVTMLPLGIEAAFHAFGWAKGVPICLLLSLVLCAVVLLVYWPSMDLLGEQLQDREQRILEIVTNRGS